VFVVICFVFEYVDKGVSVEFEIRTAVFAEKAIFCEIFVSIGKHLPKFRNLQGQSVSQSVQCTCKRRPFAVCCWKVTTRLVRHWQSLRYDTNSCACRCWLRFALHRNITRAFNDLVISAPNSRISLLVTRFETWSRR